MTPDPVAPDVEGQRRVVGIGALLALAESGDGPVDAGRSQVDLAHLGRVAIADLGARVVRRQPVGARRPGGRVGRPAGARPEAQHDRGLGRQLVARARPAGSDRSASDCTAIASRSRSISRNLPRRRMDSTRWPTRASSSAGVPRTASGPGASVDVIGRPAERRMEGVGDHGQIGQFGHGAAIVAVGRPVLDSPGPKGHGQRTSDIEPFDARRSGPRSRSPRTTSIVSDTA